MSDMANVLLAIYVWAPLMLLVLFVVWTVLLYAAWKIGTGIQRLAHKCYEKFTCKNSVNNKSEKMR